MLYLRWDIRPPDEARAPAPSMPASGDRMKSLDTGAGGLQARREVREGPEAPSTPVRRRRSIPLRGGGRPGYEKRAPSAGRARRTEGCAREKKASNVDKGGKESRRNQTTNTVF